MPIRQRHKIRAGPMGMAMKVLHLFHNPVGMDAAPRLALLSVGLGRMDFIAQDVWLLGNRELEVCAEELGLKRTRRQGVPFNQAVAAWPGLRYHLQEDDYDLLHCWSVGSLVLAMGLRPKVPRVLTLTGPLSRQEIHALRFLLTDRRAATIVLTVSSTLERELLGSGVPQEAVHVLRPGIDLGRVAHESRALLRKRWGITEDAGGPGVQSSAKPLVLGLVAQAVTRIDARQVALTVGLAEEALKDQGYRLQVLVHPDQTHLPRARRTLEQVGKDYQFVMEPRLDRPWEVIPGCDLALVMEAAAGGLSLLWAMAANVPLVGLACYDHCEVLEDRHLALLARPGDGIHMAHRISQLVSDPSLAWKLRDTARHEAFSYFSCVRYLRALQKVYEQIAGGQRVEIPALTRTGGLRFEASRL